jgi:hypothetical protein
MLWEYMKWFSSLGVAHFAKARYMSSFPPKKMSKWCELSCQRLDHGGSRCTPIGQVSHIVFHRASVQEQLQRQTELIVAHTNAVI